MKPAISGHEARTSNREAVFQAVVSLCASNHQATRKAISEAMAPTLDPPKPPAREWIAAVTADVAIGRKTTRMLLVTERPDGVNGGEWATECVKAFEQLLSDYLGYEPRSPGDGSKGQKGGDE